MKIVAFPNTPQKQVFVVKGQSATFGSAADNQICLALTGLNDYQGSLSFQDGTWVFESLDDKPFVVGEESFSSVKLRVGLKFAFAGVNFLVLDVTKVEEEASSAGALTTQVQGNAVSVAPVARQGYQVMVSQQGQYMPAMAGQFANPWEQVVIKTSDTLAKLGLLFAILGPVLLGIGEIIGLVLSLLSLSRRRNTVRGNIMAWCGVVVSLLWLAAVGLGAWYFMSRDVIIHNQTRVMARLEKAVGAEYFVKYALQVDEDKDLMGEFVPLERFKDIGGLDQRVKELGLNPLRDGYNFYSEDVTPDTFVMTATPQVYGVTGKLTFWVSEYGVIVSEDLKGQRFTDNPLAKIEDLPSRQTIQKRYEKEIADKLLYAAEVAFKNEQYRECEKILNNLRNLFPYSQAMARLTAIEKENSPFLIEAKALRLYDDVKNYLNNGQDDSALLTMRNLVQEYPEASLSVKVKKEIDGMALKLAKLKLEEAKIHVESNYWNAVEESLSQISSKYPEALSQGDMRVQIENCRKLSHDRRDQFAQNLLKKAESLELNGSSLEAYNTYLQLKDNYADTASAKGVDDCLKRLSGLLDENTAKGYIAEIMRNAALSNETVVINMINLLKTGCGETKEYKRAKDSLERIRRDCTVSLLSKEVETFLADRNYRSAQDRIEQIVAEKPEMLIPLKDKYELCLVSNFATAYKDRSYQQALDYFERYEALNPVSNVVARAEVDECRFKRGMQFFQQGDLKSTAVQLELCSAKYADRPEFNYLAGRVYAALEKWDPAVRHLLKCDKLDETYQFDMHAIRAYCLWKLIKDVEAGLIGQVCRQAEYVGYLGGYKLFQINYVELSRTNSMLNVSNVKMKVDRAKVTGDILVSIDKESFAQYGGVSHFGEGNENVLSDKEYFRSRYQTAIGLMRDTAVIVDNYNKESDYKVKREMKTKLYEQEEKIRKLYDDLKILDSREILANQSTIKVLNQEILYMKNLGFDVGFVLNQRSLPRIKPQYVFVTKKFTGLNETKKLFLDYTKRRNYRYTEVKNIVKDVVTDCRNGRATVDSLLSSARKIGDIYDGNVDMPLDFLKKLSESVKVEMDLSPLEEYLPKVELMVENPLVDPAAETSSGSGGNGQK